MPHEIASTARCGLCKKVFAGPVAIVGEGRNGRLMHYLQKLTEHFITEHKKESEALELRAMEFLGLLRIMNYETSDPELIEQRNYLRWSVNQITLPGRLPDAVLAVNCESLARILMDLVVGYFHATTKDKSVIDQLTRVFTRELETHFRAMRDHYEEPERFHLTPETVSKPS